jgi:hypothetical protein
MTPKKQIPAHLLADKLYAYAYAYADAAYASAYAGVYKGLLCQDLVFVKFELIPAMKESR